MKISVLASGSKGNCTYINTGNHHLLIDVGTSSLYIENKLKNLDVSVNNIDSVFITHNHSDHIKGLSVFIKKYNPTIYLTEELYNELSKTIMFKKYHLIDKYLNLDDLNVEIIKTSHDAIDSNGYIFECLGKTLVYITDTGYINVKNHDKLRNKNIYIMESNHDVELLVKGSYPYHLRQRILSDKGHLSNQAAADYLSNFIGNNTKHVILAHLSEENNSEDIAYKTLIETLKNNGKKIDSIIIAKANERTELIEI